MRRFDVFRRWFLKEILQVESTNSIILLPIEKLEPRYRDIFPRIPLVPPSGINQLFLSPTLGAPEIVVPGIAPRLHF